MGLALCQRLSLLRCVIKGTSTGHHGGRGDDAPLLGFDDGPVDSGSHTKVVGIYDQPAHEAQSNKAWPLAG